MPIATRRASFVAAISACLLGPACSHAPEFDVYVAGYEDNGTVLVAKLWKNGVAQPLSDGTSGAIATAVAVSNGHVHAVGCTEGSSGLDVATYWRDGAAILLTDGTRMACAEAVAVVGSDVYVAGYEGSVATWWKNGTATPLTSGSSESNALGIAVSGADVYVAGEEVEETQTGPSSFLMTNVAKLWRNGVVTRLGDGLQPSVAYAIATVGPEVYVGGFDGSLATYWKNGTAVHLSDGTHPALATGIGIADDGAVYAAGGMNGGRVDLATLWTPRGPVSLTDGSHQAFVEGIAMSGGDAYSAGYDGAVAIFWKNGQRFALTDGYFDADALGIAVVER